MEVSVDHYYISSIMKEFGRKHLYEYLIVSALKKHLGQNYFSWHDIKEYSLARSKVDWIKIMDDLCNFHVAVKADKTYTTKGKRKGNTKWFNVCENKRYNTILNTFPKEDTVVILNVDKLLSFKNLKCFGDDIYITILDLFEGKKVMTREFIHEVTGVSRNTQIAIEKRNPDKLQPIENYRIIESSDYDHQTRAEFSSGNPVFPAYVDPKLGVQRTSKDKSNCTVKQTGNVYVTTPYFKKCCSLLRTEPIKQNLRIKSKRNDKFQEDQNRESNSTEALDVNSVHDFYDEVFLFLNQDSGDNCTYRNCISVDRMDSVGYKKFNRLIGKSPTETYCLSSDSSITDINSALMNQQIQNTKVNWNSQINDSRILAKGLRDHFN